MLLSRLLFALAALAPVAALPAPAGGVRLAELGVITDDNVTAARNGSPREGEQALQLAVTQAWSVPVEPGLSLRLLARAESRWHRERRGLDELTASAEGQLWLRPSTGFYSPTLGAALGLASSHFTSALRDARESRVRLHWRQPLTTRLSSRMALGAVWRGSDGRAFDAQWHSAELALDWQAARRWQWSLGYQLREGTVASVGVPGPAALANATAVEPDDVFSGASAFAFDAQTHIGSLTGRYALAPSLTLEAELRCVESATDFGSRYRRWNTFSGLVWRF